MITGIRSAASAVRICELAGDLQKKIVDDWLLAGTKLHLFFGGDAPYVI